MNPPYVYRNIPWKEHPFGESGRVLVSIDVRRGTRLDVYNYEGSKLPAHHIFTVLKMALTKGWVETLENLHRNRITMWKAEMVVSSDGVREYRLYTTERNEVVCSSRIAVSNNEINTFSILAEDAAPLLKRIIEDYPPIFLKSCRNNRNNGHYPSLYYLDAQNTRLLTLPEPIREQMEWTRRITVPDNRVSTGTFQAGITSGLIETIEALKCLEVLQT